MIRHRPNQTSSHTPQTRTLRIHKQRRGLCKRMRPILLTGMAWALVFGGGCEPSTSVSPAYRPQTTRPAPAQNQQARRGIVLPTITSIQREPTLRVRIAKSLPRANVSSASGLLVGPANIAMNAKGRRYPSAVAVTLQQGSFLITDTDRHSIRWAVPALRLSPLSPGTHVSFNGKTYPGTIVLVPVTNSQGIATGLIDVVNHVGMESYLPGVVERELYGSWNPETFRAAVIAARSYAVFESSLNARRHYDLESTTASQAYSGRATNPKALSAVTQTRGMLLEYGGRVVPAFYSSACGGSGQDAVAAFTWLPGLPDIQPLRGQNHGAYCSKSSKFRWGPITRAKSSLAVRVRSWGEREGHPVKALRDIRDIRIARVNSVGRPTAFAVTDNAGMLYTLGPEQFRFACNANTSKLGAVPKGRSLNSSHVQVSVSTSSVTFHDGRGYGHGVGLCQFGAQKLAQSGYNAYSILAFYYPGSRVVRAYR